MEGLSDFAKEGRRRRDAVGQEDVDRLRSLGLSDRDILDALAAEPDARFAELDAPLRDALTVGRPLAE